MVLLIVAIIAAPIMAIVALVTGIALQNRVKSLEARLQLLQDQVWKGSVEKPAVCATSEAEPRSPAPATQSEQALSPIEAKLREDVVASATAPAPPPPDPAQPAPPGEWKLPPLPSSFDSLKSRAAVYPPKIPTFSSTAEMMVGTRWLNWAGAVMLIIGMALLMKYAYDNSFIGPKGRLIGGVIAGVVALLFSERSLRRGLPVVFQATAGLGHAILFTAIYFAAQVHQFIPHSMALALAVGVVVLAVVTAVARNAQSIAIIATAGGFISPIVMLDWQYRPHAFFLYVTVISLIALAAAWKRSWHYLEVLSFLGAALVYISWYDRFGAPPLALERLPHVLGYLTLISVLFLVLPLLNQLVHRRGESRLSIQLVIADSLFFIVMAYFVLYRHYPHHWLGWAALAQAALVTVMFGVWVARRGMETNTAKALLVIAVALATYSVPLHLSLYAIPLVWAMEALLLISVGLIFNSVPLRQMGLLALLLAGWGLIDRWPMHTKPFRPVVNIAFASWMVAGLSSAAGAGLLNWKRKLLRPEDRGLIAATSAVAFVYCGYALTVEVVDYWLILRAGLPQVHTPMTSSVILMWSLIVMVAAMALRLTNKMGGKLILLPLAAAIVPWYFQFWLMSMGETGWVSARFLINWASLPRLMYPAALFLLAGLMKSSGVRRDLRHIIESGGHIALVLLLGEEIVRWSGVWVGERSGERMGMGVVSAVWALYAAGLIWAGLVTRSPLRRWLGFALFAITTAKVLLVDTERLETAYRIVSFLGTGAFLMIAGYLYNRFAARLAAEEDDPAPQ